MAKWGKVDFSQLKELQKRLMAFEQAEIDDFCKKCSKDLAARLLAKTIVRTPVGTKPKLDGPKTQKVTGASGKTRSFLTAEGARQEQYWAGYVGGTLRRGWVSQTHEQAAANPSTPNAAEQKAFVDSLPVKVGGGSYVIDIINPVEYAIYVEYGHRQEPGRYVPALGKKLKSGWVKGQFMLTKSEIELQGQADGILQKLLEQKIREVLNGE